MKLTKWRAKVAEARNNGRFSNNDKQEAELWPSCAMGERFNITYTMRVYYAAVAKHGRVISDLGHDFHYAVSGDKIDEAEKIITKIEELPDL